LIRRLVDALGPGHVMFSEEDRSVYSFDAGNHVVRPRAVVMPENVREVSTVVRIAKEFGAPIIPRGAGTGLCGASVASESGIVLSFARMNRLISFDADNRRARVQPGYANLALSQAMQAHGLFFGPDPSSQKIATIGGNAGTNAGGPHALSYGSMSAHVLGVQFVDSDGEVHRAKLDDAGYDLVGLQVGAEGTLSILTAIDVRLLRIPAAVRVALATFSDVESASASVSAIIAAGIQPTALEIMDQFITQAVEEHFHAGFPTDAGAVLLIELAGPLDDVNAYEAMTREIMRSCEALSWRSADDPQERQRLWASRKGAAAAMGRHRPNYYIQDATVPRTKLPEAVRAVEEIARAHNLMVGNVLHAGDGNLHPLLLFDRGKRGEIDAVRTAGTEILRACIDLGGTISGEHGIGFEKRDSLTRVFTPEDLAAMGRVRDVFDPERRFNPDKVFPSGASCGEVRSGMGLRTPTAEKLP
jgi:glycolate oxidase